MSDATDAIPGPQFTALLGLSEAVILMVGRSREVEINFEPSELVTIHKADLERFMLAYKAYAAALGFA